MKKHDEGYVMLLVVVVILVLSIVSAALMSMTVTNLKNQRNSVDRMQEKYSAQGEMEKQVAAATAKLEENSSVDIQVEPIDAESTEPTPEDAVKKWITESLLLDAENGELKVEEETFTWTIPLSPVESESGKTEISCTLELHGKVKEKEAEPPAEDDEDAQEANPMVKTFTVTFSQWKYTSYEITEKEVQPSE